MTKAIPTSQCMTCHMHPGTNMLATYQGLTWWDNETDGDKMYPQAGRKLNDAERVEIEKRNPEGSALRGLWSRSPSSCEKTGEPGGTFNASLKQTQFADFHGHGWLFRAVFKRDRKGNLLDAQGNPGQGFIERRARRSGELHGSPSARANVRPRWPHARPSAPGKPVHLKDIHLERGMQCVDCHFKQDSHGNGNLYGEPRNGIEITCVDCHGTARRRAYGTDRDKPVMRTTGPAAPEAKDGRGTNLLDARLLSASREARFEVQDDGKLLQRSVTDENLSWVVPQVFDSNLPGNAAYNEKARFAHTVQRDGKTWGDGMSPDLAHADERMTCATCHSSWITSCFGCHLAQTANQKRDDAAQRGDQDAQLDVVQLPGAARRRLHAGQGRQRGRRHGSRRSARRAPSSSARRT